jgi:L-fucose dehydrogenase
MNLCLQNKVIIISGSSSVNVENLIRVLSDEGAILIFVGKIDLNDLKLKQDIEISSRNTILVKAELGNPADCENAVRNIIQEYGRIDGLVNDAGVNEYPELGYTEIFSESVQKNLVHYYLMTHFVLPYLKISKGVIVNISFNSSGTNRENSAIHAASKGGINSLTREWAVELLKYGIRVNAILVKEYVLDMSNVVAFLLSEKSSHTTGQLIRFGS